MPLLRPALFVCAVTFAACQPALADENLLGYVRGAEVLPKGASEIYQWFTQRSDKGAGTYRAIDSKTEFEYGVTDRFQVSAALTETDLHLIEKTRNEIRLKIGFNF